MNDEVRIWRAAIWSRIGASAMVLTFAPSFCFVAVISDFPALALSSALLPPFFLWRMAFHPRIELDTKALRVTNPFSSCAIPLTDIVDAESGYSGIEIRRRNGRKRVAWAVQRANVSLFVGRETRSDRIVTEIKSAAAAARDSPAPGEAETNT